MHARNKMAVSGGRVVVRSEILDSVLEVFKQKLGFSIQLRKEQNVAVNCLLDGKDVLAVLPTGFGKSLIFQTWVKATSLLEQARRATVLVITPLNSISEDQILEAHGLGITTASLSDLSEEELKSANFQLLFSSAKSALDPKFLNTLKDRNFALHHALSGIVVDESHVIEMWTGRRSNEKGKVSAFREAFAQLSTLRSFCKQGTPVLALTGTADIATQQCIIKSLAMNNPKMIFISPNRGNLKISVLKCKREEHLDHLLWMVQLLKGKGSEAPKTIIFCNGSLTDIATVLNFFLVKLGNSAYSPSDVQTSENCLIGIYHSLTLAKYKERLISSMKGNGKKRVAIATAALSMGVNFPDIRYVVHWGPPRNLLDYHQECRRAGRDGKDSDVVTIYYGQQAGLCEQTVKDMLQSTGCQRVAAYKPFDNSVQPLLNPAHKCCQNCARSCKCGGATCRGGQSLFETEVVLEAPAEQTLSRPVSAADKADLKEAMAEMVELIFPVVNLLNVNSPANYADQLVAGIIEKSNSIFTVTDITERFSVFSVQHALKIQEIFNEIFEDIPNLDAMVELFGRSEACVIEPEVFRFEDCVLGESDSDDSVEAEDA